MVRFFNRQKKTKTSIMPFKNMSEQDIKQNRMNMQAELDRIDFEAAKANREARLKREKSMKRRETIRDVHRSLDAGLSIFDDSILKDPIGDKRKKQKPIIDDPFGEMRF